MSQRPSLDEEVADAKVAIRRRAFVGGLWVCVPIDTAAPPYSRTRTSCQLRAVVEVTRAVPVEPLLAVEDELERADEAGRR